MVYTQLGFPLLLDIVKQCASCGGCFEESPLESRCQEIGNCRNNSVLLPRRDCLDIRTKWLNPKLRHGGSKVFIASKRSECISNFCTELQIQYQSYKNNLQAIAGKIGDVEQEAEEHKYVGSVIHPRRILSNDS